ncbi:MAG TPA: response regulator [Candidatus Saccharimonadales bacterium]|nr:response regulator [Candidatus Saccharimonadales bacterium]
MSHVLLLEPNTVLAAAYTEALQHAGHTVAHTTGAQAAIHAADAQAPDAVLLELLLPQHNGVEFLHEFRSYTDWQTTPVIVNTVLHPSYLGGLHTVLVEDFGVQTILYKPQTSLQEVVRAVRGHTSQT